MQWDGDSSTYAFPDEVDITERPRRTTTILPDEEGAMSLDLSETAFERNIWRVSLREANGTIRAGRLVGWSKKI